jgi:tol-pal system protein YbgF
LGVGKPMNVVSPAGGNVTKPVGIQIPPSMTAVDHYNKAYAYLTAADYPKAQVWLEAFVARHPTDKLADNAFYWLGESRLVQNNAVGAAQAFRDGLRSFPKGEKAPANLLKLGIALEQLKQVNFAKTAWAKLLKDFPKSPEAELARTRLAGIKG